MTWTRADYDTLAALTFVEGYPGYKPNVAEVPHGDGNVDAQKRYAHVACKYLPARPYTDINQDYRSLHWFLQRAHASAEKVAEELGVPDRFWPVRGVGALRVLYYPAGVGGHLHTDFDLFAVNLWRSHPNPGLGGGRYHIGEIGELVGLGPAEPHYVAPLPEPQLALVYFAIPDHAAVLPGGEQRTVDAWLTERIARSRVEVTK